MSRPRQQWVWLATVIEWIDGDTVDVVIDRGFRDYSRKRIRVSAVDAPEKRGRKAEPERAAAAQARCEALCPVGSLVDVRTVKEEGKYGRWIADVWPEDRTERRTVAQILIAEGLASPY